MKIEEGKRVRMKAKLVAGGDVLEESVVEYIQGSGKMLPGLEAELEGLAAGAKKKGVIPAARAFGSSAHQPKKPIPRAEFPKNTELTVGAQFAAKAENGQEVVLRVSEISDETVTVTLVHPLAEKDIDYDVEILAVTDPKPPPLPAEAIAEEES